MNSEHKEYIKRLLRLKQNKVKNQKTLLMSGKSYRRVRSKATELRDIEKEINIIQEIYTELK